MTVGRKKYRHDVYKNTCVSSVGVQVIGLNGYCRLYLLSNALDQAHAQGYAIFTSLGMCSRISIESAMANYLINSTASKCIWVVRL